MPSGTTRKHQEVLDGAMVIGFGGVQTELTVQVPPSESQRGAEREHPVGEPQVEIEAQGRTA